MSKKIYLDYQATTPVDLQILKKMMPYFNENFGNPHSNNHEFGRQANEVVDEARLNIAKLINAKNLVITHYSSRIKNTESLKLEASNEFGIVHAASDSDIINLTHDDIQIISQS